MHGACCFWNVLTPHHKRCHLYNVNKLGKKRVHIVAPLILSAAPVKSGPHDFPSEKSFLLFFAHVKGLGHIFQKQFSCSSILFFCVVVWLHLLTKNTGKAFIHMTKINCLVMTLYEVFNRLRTISFFFSFLGLNGGINRKHILHSSIADQSTGFFARSRVLPQRLNSREIGKTCQQKWKIQHQNHDYYDFLITYKREPRQRHDWLKT